MRFVWAAAVCVVMACGRSDLGGEFTAVAGPESSNGMAAAPAPPAPVAPAAKCRTESVGSFEGVSLRMVQQPCRFTLAEVAQGITLKAELVAETESPFLESSSLFACQRPEPAGVFVAQRVFGGTQSYAVTDLGRCQTSQGVVGVKPGISPLSLRWTGHNWSGPADYGRPLGPAFPPGTYAYEVHAEVGDARADMDPVELTATLYVELVP